MNGGFECPGAVAAAPSTSWAMHRARTQTAPNNLLHAGWGLR